MVYHPPAFHWKWQENPVIRKGKVETKIYFSVKQFSEVFFSFDSNEPNDVKQGNSE